MRIDQLLVYRQHASTRSQAQRLIADGVLWQQGDAWKRVLKNGDEVPEDAPIQLLNTAEARYVSRGGLKLEAALAHVQLDVSGMACLDVGQSTGGFTDCLLRHGAASVVGVDVGSAQLHPQLRTDPRVLCVEKVNARALTADDLLQAYEDSIGEQGVFDSDGEPDDTDEAVYNFAPPFDLIVADLSFISQTLVLPAVVALLKPGGSLLTLVKPQFELQPGQVGKGGIVKDVSLYLFVEQRLRDACAALGLEVTAWFESPIAGGDGNREFFIFARHPG
jgi:23S rRNA (cytidine1920-2'-O)/16S rRNA (cytidine1409-2'-O)-methyltransferase